MCICDCISDTRRCTGSERNANPSTLLDYYRKTECKERYDQRLYGWFPTVVLNAPPGDGLCSRNMALASLAWIRQPMQPAYRHATVHGRMSHSSGIVYKVWLSIFTSAITSFACNKSGRSSFRNNATSLNMAPPTIIHAQGRAVVNHPADRAALVIDIFDEGSTQETVSNHVVTTANQLQAEVDKLCPRLSNGEISPEAPVSFYSIDSLSTTRRDEYGPDNKRTGLQILGAKTSLDVRFRDFTKLGELVVKLSTIPYVQLRGIDWKLTEETTDRLSEQVRVDALRNAVKMAKAYANVISRPNVTAVKITDSKQDEIGRVMQMARKSTPLPSSVAGGLDFEPKTISLSASLDVEFQAE